LDARRIVESLVFSAVRKKVAEWGEDAEVPVSLEIPRQESHGDFSTNAAMQLAKCLGRKPRAVAEEIVSALREEDRRGRFESLSIAGPGFINIVLSEEFWREVLTVALEKGPRFGASKTGEGQTVHLEFVSANPTGPLHVGHGAAPPSATPLPGSSSSPGTRSSANITSTTSETRWTTWGARSTRDTAFCADVPPNSRRMGIAGST